VNTLSVLRGGFEDSSASESKFIRWIQNERKRIPVHQVRFAVSKANSTAIEEFPLLSHQLFPALPIQYCIAQAAGPMWSRGSA